MQVKNSRMHYYLYRLVTICRDVNNPGICCKGESRHITWEETSEMGAVVSKGIKNYCYG